MTNMNQIAIQDHSNDYGQIEGEASIVDASTDCLSQPVKMSAEPSTSKRTKSIAHQYFDTKNKNSKNEVKCSLCPKWISYTGGVTSNLIAHLRVSVNWMFWNM